MGSRFKSRTCGGSESLAEMQGFFYFLAMQFFVYILYSASRDSYYIGHSEDPHRRLFQHNTGKFHKSTSSGRPWIVKAIFQISGDRGEAMKIESFIKKQKSKILIEKLLDPRFVPSGSLAQLVRVPHVRD